MARKRGQSVMEAAAFISARVKLVIFLAEPLFITLPFPYVASTGGDQPYGLFPESEGHYKQEPLHLTEGQITRLSIIAAVIFQNHGRGSHYQGGLPEINPVLFQILTALIFIPLEVHRLFYNFIL
jgi:hypothetical protein